ncbi:MAG TPA: DNA-binding protein [Candidatus Dojkabacteria bacterium]|nr:DNA-binding protein [Candidatus Dojkabacteria bacterium]HRO64853.1 DNA-binding protein [Candidatus Dojkabacteria bacterium]HRP38016.1 DNA-binding protein [Candidatus Dojkabacteria bacterium]HRP50853.1 DNA-binding protein [Candidatus Dojkabacteria bacterium]
MKTFVERLHKGSDLKLEIKRIAKENHFSAACIVNAVGSLSKLIVRTDVRDGKPVIKEYGKVEVVSLIGTIGKDGDHLHIHIAGGQIDGIVVGGHLVDGCIVHTTVELMFLVMEEMEFITELDSNTGFDELVVKKVKS